MIKIREVNGDVRVFSWWNAEKLSPRPINYRDKFYRDVLFAWKLYDKSIKTQAGMKM